MGSPWTGVLAGLQPIQTAIGSTHVAVGWLEHGDGLTLSNDLPGLLGGISNIRPVPLRGVWTSVTTTVPIREGLGVQLSGAALLPRESGGLITSNIGSTADFDGEGLQWTYLQSLAQCDMAEGLSLLAGARWDQTQVRFHVTRPGTGNDDFIVHAYMPLVGLQVREGSPKGLISLQVLGFPAVPGTIKFHTWSETSSYSQHSSQDFVTGHYLEVQADWRCRVHESLDASLFGRWDLLHASTSVENALVPAPVRAIRWNVDRRSWTVGMGIRCSLNLL
jgi:hypothetical protein